MGERDRKQGHFKTMMNQIKPHFKQKVSAKSIKGQHECIQGTIWLKHFVLDCAFTYKAR